MAVRFLVLLFVARTGSPGCENLLHKRDSAMLLRRRIAPNCVFERRVGDLCFVYETFLVIVLVPMFNVVEHRHEYNSSFETTRSSASQDCFNLNHDLDRCVTSKCAHWSARGPILQRVLSPMSDPGRRCCFPHTIQSQRTH